MGVGPMVAIMLMQQNQRRMEEQRRRRRRQEEEDRRRRQRKREEEERMIEHRKNSPVVYNNEDWQQNRCLKAISMQPSVKRLVSLIDEERPKVIQTEEKKYDKQIIEVGYQYEQVRRELESIMTSLREIGVSIDGKQYELKKIASDNINMTKPEPATETFGSTFTIQGGQPISITPDILLRQGYYQDRYQEMNPDELEQEFTKTSSRMKRYQTFGKYLGFLLKTRRYLELEAKAKKLTTKHEECELRKKEMESYQSLTAEQLETIKSYFEKLRELKEVSQDIKGLFYEKSELSSESNEKVYNTAIQDVISNGDNSGIVDQAHEYISRVQTNDEKTMKEAHELVKGEYPIELPRKFLYSLIIANMNDYGKENPYQKIHS